MSKFAAVSFCLLIATGTSGADLPTVEVTKATRGAISHRIEIPATLEPYDQADLYAKVSGYIAEVKADIGDHVKSGQVLAVIDVPEVVAQLAQAKAEHQAKQKMLAAADASVEQAEKLAETTRRQLDH